MNFYDLLSNIYIKYLKMGAIQCCSSKDMQSTGMMLNQVKIKRSIVKNAWDDYDVYSDFKPVYPPQKITIAVHPNELTLGTWDCGWGC